MQKKGESQRVLNRLPPAGRAFDVLGVGENSWDILATVPHWPSADEKLELQDLVSLPGGQAASALVGCARLGCRAQYVGVFGDDEHGRAVERALRGEGVETSTCLTARAPNRSAFIVVDPAAGTRAVLWRRDAALNWPDTSAFADYIAQTRSVLVDTTDINAAISAAQAARFLGVPVVVDIDAAEAGIDGVLKHVDVLIAAEAFPQAHTGASSLGAAMRQLAAEYDSALVIVTLGASGAVCWDGASEGRSPGFVVPVVDPTGAGDAFRAGFMAAWLQGSVNGRGTLADILDFANATAALNCRAVGAQAGLPARSEVVGLLTDPAVRRSNTTGSATQVGPS
ncbi:MAG: carbohydrate kinase family protein [Vicinamibacterales bacterium]